MYNTKAFMKNQIIIDENAHIMPSDITIWQMKSFFILLSSYLLWAYHKYIELLVIDNWHALFIKCAEDILEKSKLRRWCKYILCWWFY